MENLLKELKMLFSLILLGAFYGGLIGAGIALMTGNNAWVYFFVVAVAWSVAVAVAVAGTWLFSLTGAVGFVGVGAWVFALVMALVVALVVAGAWVGIVLVAVAVALIYLAEQNKTTLEALVEEHTQWLLSFPIALVRFLFTRKPSINSHKKSEAKQRAWDVSLIITFTQELTEVFPEEWDEWQHWISDMIDSRTRMQSKGMNHRLVSLITFYRLLRFALHIGIDKVFILATRRATR